MGSELHEAAAQGFPGAAASYEAGRPTYPPQAVARLARELHLGTGRAVLDLAAGTGKLTALLVGTGACVVAVEPVAEMRAVLEAALPGVRALPGTAEAIPLGSGTVDAVTVGQAFHWFRGDEALREIHRVLRPGGGLGLLWNVRDTSVPWVARLSELMEPHRRDAPAYRSGAWREAFERTTLFGRLGHADGRARPPAASRRGRRPRCLRQLRRRAPGGRARGRPHGGPQPVGHGPPDTRPRRDRAPVPD